MMILRVLEVVVLGLMTSSSRCYTLEMEILLLMKSSGRWCTQSFSPWRCRWRCSGRQAKCCTRRRA